MNQIWIDVQSVKFDPRTPLEYGIIIENCKSESLMLNLRQLIDPLMHRIPYFIRINFLINTCNCIFNLFN